MLCHLEALDEVELAIEPKGALKVRCPKIGRIYKQARSIHIGSVEADDVADAQFPPLGQPRADTAPDIQDRIRVYQLVYNWHDNGGRVA